jgi:type I restriction enzyme S subunit
MSEEKLPKGWRKSKLSEVVEILDNLRVPVSSSEREKRIGNIPYYGATGQTGWIDDFIFDEELVLLGEDGAPFFDKKKNVAYIVKGKSWVNNHAHVLRALTLITSNKFVLYFLNHFDYTGYVGGTTRLKLTQGSLKIIPIPLPPLPEQQRIVAKLDAVFGHLDSLREKLDRIPELLKNFRQQVLTQAVTGELTREWREGKDLGEWKDKPIEQLAEVISGFAFKSTDFTNQGFQVIRMGNLYNNKLDLSRNPVFLPTSFDPKIIEKYTIKKGDVLLSMTGTKYKKDYGYAIEVHENGNLLLNQRIVALRPKINSTFLMYLLQNEIFREQFFSFETGGNNQGNVGVTSLKSIELQIPSSFEQEEIVNRVDALFGLTDKIESQYQSLKAKIEQLPQVVLAKAFRGELVGQEVKEYVREIGELGMVAEHEEVEVNKN